ncbi:uncharacterized protein K441DRAFT_672227, partial [Cenococcum geophilum 1.58]
AEPPSAKRQPKRIILRLRVNEFTSRDYSEYIDAIKAYLAFAGPPDVNQISFHITIDMEKDTPNPPTIQELLHKIYRYSLFYKLANLAYSQVKRIQNVIEEKNYLTRIRKYSNVLYP